MTFRQLAMTLGTGHESSIVCAERDIAQGEQLLHTYGDLSDAQLLQTYGFVEELEPGFDNPHNFVPVPAQLLLQSCNESADKVIRLLLWWTYCIWASCCIIIVCHLACTALLWYECSCQQHADSILPTMLFVIPCVCTCLFATLLCCRVHALHAPKLYKCCRHSAETHTRSAADKSIAPLHCINFDLKCDVVSGLDSVLRRAFTSCRRHWHALKGRRSCWSKPGCSSLPLW